MKLSTKVSDSSNPTSIKDATKEISKAMTLIADKLAAIHLVYNFDDIITTIGQSLDTLSDALINAGCKPEYLASYKTWGDYGWTISPKTGKKFFLEKAESLHSADETMRQFCSIENIIEINNILCSHGVNSNDLEIAKTCCENHRYKPCAMLLFSMIDGYLIDQKIFGVGKDGNQFLKTGLSTVLVLKENDDKVFTDDDFLCMLQYKLIIHGLMSLFKQCTNFENEPSVINRNFVMHGKSTKTITDTDCYKLWSALYSLVVAYPNLKRQISKNDSE